MNNLLRSMVRAVIAVGTVMATQSAIAEERYAVRTIETQTVSLTCISKADAEKIMARRKSSRIATDMVPCELAGRVIKKTVKSVASAADLVKVRTKTATHPCTTKDDAQAELARLKGAGIQGTILPCVEKTAVN